MRSVMKKTDNSIDKHSYCQSHGGYVLLFYIMNALSFFTGRYIYKNYKAIKILTFTRQGNFAVGTPAVAV